MLSFQLFNGRYYHISIMTRPLQWLELNVKIITEAGMNVTYGFLTSVKYQTDQANFHVCSSAMFHDRNEEFNWILDRRQQIESNHNQDIVVETGWRVKRSKRGQFIWEWMVPSASVRLHLNHQQTNWKPFITFDRSIHRPGVFTPIWALLQPPTAFLLGVKCACWANGGFFNYFQTQTKKSNLKFRSNASIIESLTGRLPERMVVLISCWTRSQRDIYPFNPVSLFMAAEIRHQSHSKSHNCYIYNRNWITDFTVKRIRPMNGTTD